MIGPTDDGEGYRYRAMNQKRIYFLTGIFVVSLILAGFLPFGSPAGAAQIAATQAPGLTVRLFLPAVSKLGGVVGNPGPNPTATLALAPSATPTLTPTFTPTFTSTPTHRDPHPHADPDAHAHPDRYSYPAPRLE